MPGDAEFDMEAAVEEIGAGLGLEMPAESGEREERAATVETGSEDTTASNEANLAEPPDTTAAEKTPEAGPATPDAASGVGEPPKTWRKEALAEWEKVPPAARAEITKREADFFRGIEEYKADAAFGKGLKAAIDPYLPTLQRYGIDPGQHVGKLLEAHETLALGSPEKKAELFQKLAADYGVDIAALSAEPPYLDPAVKDLQSGLHEVKSRLQQQENARAAAVQSEKLREVQAFVNDPAHTYVEEVAKDMAVLLDKGVCATLQQAYDQAIWVNPVVRAKEVARQQAETAAKQAKEAADRVATAKKATAANVKAREKGHSGTTPLGTMDDTLKSTYAAIASRS